MDNTSEVGRILGSIKNRRELETNANVEPLAFGRIDGRLNDEGYTFWIVPHLLKVLPDSVPPDAIDSDTDISVSRDGKLGAILIQNDSGTHGYSVKDPIITFKKTENTVEIFNKTKYTPYAAKYILARDFIITFADAADKPLSFRDFREAILLQENISNIEKDIVAANSEHRNEDAERLREKLERKKREQKEHYVKTQRFIRQNAELRWQPILDPKQDAIKRVKVFDGGTLVINGGPGTGKTTSLVQRIKFLISGTITEYINLSANYKDIIFNQKTGWIFFSPSRDLGAFLKNTMGREGLATTDDIVQVWEKYRLEVMKLYGWLDESKRIFRRYKPRDWQPGPFTDPNRIGGILNGFYKYYFEQQIKRLSKNGFAVTLYIDSNDTVNINNIFQQHYNIYRDKIYKSKFSKYEKSDDYKFRKDEGEVLLKTNSLKTESGKEAFGQTLASLLDDITIAYKEYRKEALHENNNEWNIKTLKELIGDQNQNQEIHPDEQALLIYLVNVFCRSIYKLDPSSFRNAGHQYAKVYMSMCKPVIAIDEAADFSVIELLAMHSFRHPDISSVTISGDLMQRMTGNGLQNWESFTEMVESPLIENLTKSYRQSPTLLSIAQDIYRYSTEKNAEYTSYMDNDPSEPKPLMIISEDPTDRLVWIADRIREIDTIYRASVGALPSVAVFVPYENDIESFRSELDEKLDGDFDIINGSVAGGRGAIKVYAVNKVKGLEFEAAFFHDLDKLETLEDNLLLKYLYVGLSRATFYLGITLSKNLKNELRFIEERFTKNGRWKEARPEETKNDNDGNDD